MAKQVVATYFLLTESSTDLDKIPDTWSLIRFDTADILYICPMCVRTDFGYGCEGGSKSDPLGKLATRFKWVVQQARTQKSDIKIVLSSMMGPDLTYSDLDTDEKRDAHAASVRDLMEQWNSQTWTGDSGQLISGRLDGYDLDYEAQNVQEWAGDVLTRIRKYLDELSVKTGNKYQVSVTPATTDCLQNMAPVLDLVNMQNYDGGSDTGPDSYLQGPNKIKNLKPSQLLWGNSFELPVTLRNTAESLSDSVAQAQATWKGDTESGPLAGVMSWRINSDDWVWQNMAQIDLWNKIKGTPQPEGLESLVDKGWLMDGGRDKMGSKGVPIPPYTQADWVAMNEWRMVPE